MAPPPTELEDKSLAELHELAAERDVPRFRSLRREQLIEALSGASEGRSRSRGRSRGRGRGRGRGRADVDELEELEEAAPQERDDAESDEEDEEEGYADAETSTGVLEIVPDGFGFMRVEGFGRADGDVFVTRTQIRSLGLRSGDELSGPVRPKRRSERHASLGEVRNVNGRDADEVSERPGFADLTPVYPQARLSVAGGSSDLDLRMADLVAPFVKGGRVLISGPPRTGATSLLRRLLYGAPNDGSITPIVVLVDARPEEATDWRRAAGYPVHSTPADASADSDVELATLALERARRLVEHGDDVLLAIDSISRLGRSHSLARSRNRGEERASAVQFAKRWFAAGRNTEEGGSLTIMATAHADDLLHEALADIATSELVLDSELAGAGLDPPIDVRRSFARPEGVLAGETEQLRRLHAALQPLPAREAWQHVAEQIRV